jgi:hypothetical protein
VQTLTVAHQMYSCTAKMREDLLVSRPQFIVNIATHDMTRTLQKYMEIKSNGRQIKENSISYRFNRS